MSANASSTLTSPMLPRNGAGSRERLDIGTADLPPRLRPAASTSVLDVTEWFGETSGGIRTYLLQKGQYVAERPWLRHVLLVPGETDGISDEAGVRMYRLQGPPMPRRKPYRFMLATRSIARVVKHEQPDIIEIGSPFVVPWIVRHATRAMDVPMVSFYHTNVPRMFAPRAEHDHFARRIGYRAAWQYMRKLDRLFPLTIVASEYSARELAQQGIERVVRVPLGVDLALFAPAKRARAAEARKAFGLPDGPLAGFVGRMAREKNIVTVLDAWSQIERATGARLVLAGAGPIENDLRRHPYASRVTFLPFQKDRGALSLLLASLDLYVAPGPIETFGLSAIEALSSGTPVLCCDRGAVQEYVMAAHGGAVFETESAPSLAETAIALFRDDLDSMGRAARAYVEREHSWPTVFDRLFRVYDSVLQRPS
ncbi:MAG: glycosyltransferase [Gemmatimonas sp.]